MDTIKTKVMGGVQRTKKFYGDLTQIHKIQLGLVVVLLITAIVLKEEDENTWFSVNIVAAFGLFIAFLLIAPFDAPPHRSVMSKIFNKTFYPTVYIGLFAMCVGVGYILVYLNTFTYFTMMDGVIRERK